MHLQKLNKGLSNKNSPISRAASILAKLSHPNGGQIGSLAADNYVSILAEYGIEFSFTPARETEEYKAAVERMESAGREVEDILRRSKVSGMAFTE